MIKDWSDNIQQSGRADRFITNKYWERSSSEPDLADSHHLNDRFRIKNPHEYIAVDDLKYFRRKQPIDFHTKSNICLFDKDEPVLPFSSLKSEYRWRYKDPIVFNRPGLLRKSTSLKLQGQMEIETEHKAKYLPYSEEQILRCKPPSFRNPENLILEGDLEYNPEYKSAFIQFPTSVRQRKFTPVETFKIHGDIALTKETEMSASDIEDSKFIRDENKAESQKCHLKLEGEMSYMPEYRSQFVPYQIEKSHSIPQLSNIHFNGTFYGIPSEYRESYKFYDNYSKSAPIKKADHLRMQGQVEAYPEYKEQFKDPDLARQKTDSLKTDDHLKPEGEFSRDVPEYYESFKDPKVRQMPERGKCREPYLRLKGKIEFNPEYRSTYLDYPRSRPIVKKAQSSLRISNSSKSPFGSPRKRFQSTSPRKYHDPNDELPFTEKPEYRKANFIYQIRERTPNGRQIAQVQGVVKTPTVSAKKTFSDSGSVDLKSAKRNLEAKKRTPRRRESTFIGKVIRGESSSTDKENALQNVEHFDENLKKPSPRYGRRASISRNSKNIREKSSIIEGNPKYIKGERHGAEDSSFVVLDEPCKESNWMKKSWYEA